MKLSMKAINSKFVLILISSLTSCLLAVNKFSLFIPFHNYIHILLLLCEIQRDKLEFNIATRSLIKCNFLHLNKIHYVNLRVPLNENTQNSFGMRINSHFYCVHYVFTLIYIYCVQIFQIDIPVFNGIFSSSFRTWDIGLITYF